MNDTAQDFERLLGEMRPKLHRYCARMTGSVIDGEDIVRMQTYFPKIIALASLDSIAGSALLSETR
jgi:hypothetical protein